MQKITMTHPGEMDGDEMTRILWQIIKDELLAPFVELKMATISTGREERRDRRPLWYMLPTLPKNTVLP